MRLLLTRFFTCMIVCVGLLFGTTNNASAVITPGATYPFSVTTTSIASDGTFGFRLSAKGTFYVDCGDGGTLSGTGVSGGTITKSDTTDYTYTCTYSTAGIKTIRFGGLATEYNTTTSPNSSAPYAIAAIRFNLNGKDSESYYWDYSDTNAALISSISGDLSVIFPYLGSASSQQPRFYQTFRGCVNLASIPEDLFSNITSGASNMFYQTFQHCSSLTTVPSRLFSRITTGGTAMFRGTFVTSGLTTLPETLFAGITTGGNGMFRDTFEHCSNLTGYIPPTLFAGLIANGSPYSSDMMHYIFYDTGSLATSCPSGTTRYTTSYDSYWHSHVSCRPNSSLTITYSCGAGTGNAPTTNRTATYNSSFTPAANTCTAPTGTTFAGWAVSGTNDVKPAGTAFTWTYLENKTFTAKYNYPFSVTTTNLSAGDEFKFKLGVKGTFYVDCGNGGTLSGTGVSGKTITRTSFSETTYTCSYPNDGGVKTIGFGGSPTQYTVSTSIGFATPTLVASISGSLSALFPQLSSGTYKVPVFYYAFSGCTNLTSIPDNLFSGYTIGIDSMFQYTFYRCSGLTSIPDGLFSSITTSSPNMFNGTFSGCTGLASIPENLFSFGGGNVPGKRAMFNVTFSDCSGITSIPAGLFSHITSGAEQLFLQTFYNTGITSIPENLFSFGNNYVAGQPSMFSMTFYGCNGLTSIPGGLFSHVTTSASAMFGSTFKECRGLTSLPSGLFAQFTTAASSMFADTFKNCLNLRGYIPPDMFAGLIANGSPYDDNNNMMSRTFDGTALATSCASYNKVQYITNYESYWNNKVSCGTGYTVTYACGDGTGNAPTTHTSAVYDGIFTPAANSCTKDGFHFTGWAVSGTNDVKPAGTAFTWNYNENKTFTAQWTANTVPLSWYNGDTQLTVSNDAQQCTYGGIMTLPSTPVAPTGYEFDGWTIKVIE